ncbi:MAG: GNAT family N-acetyltransferase, partial [Verrucomicrobiota bacterium]
MNYAVRQIKEADFLEYYDCLGRVAREKKYLAFQDAPPIEGAISWVESHIKQNHPLHVVQFRNRVVGWCDVTPSPREVFAHCGELGMGLVKEFRGRGLGKLLIDSVLEHSISIGVERIELDVRTDNVNAISLYEKTG